MLYGGFGIEAFIVLYIEGATVVGEGGISVGRILVCWAVSSIYDVHQEIKVFDLPKTKFLYKKHQLLCMTRQNDVSGL